MIFKKYLLILITILTNNFVYSQNEILGKWLPTDKLGQIEIFKENNKYYGKIVRVNNPINPKTDEYWKDSNNPDKTKRSRKIIGITMMFDFEYDVVKKEFINGKLYDVRTGKTFKGKMWLEDNKLVLRGYWFLFYQTE